MNFSDTTSSQNTWGLFLLLYAKCYVVWSAVSGDSGLAVGRVRTGWPGLLRGMLFIAGSRGGHVRTFSVPIL